MDKLRIVVQLVVTFVTNGFWHGFAGGSIYKSNLKGVCVPGLNCYSCPGALGSCPLGAFQSVATEKNFILPLYAIGFIFAVGAVAGKFVCGWLCPFGLVQDLLYKIPVSKKLKKLPGDKILKLLKYAILVLFIIILPMFLVNDYGVREAWFCKWICPSGTLMAAWPLAILNKGIAETLGFIFIWKSLILIAIMILALFLYRPFCRYLCPLGALYGGCNKISIYKYKIDKDSCISCGKCQDVCKLNIKVYESPNSLECIRCGNCIKACPQNAIKKGVFK